MFSMPFKTSSGSDLNYAEQFVRGFNDSSNCTQRVMKPDKKRTMLSIDRTNERTVRQTDKDQEKKWITWSDFMCRHLSSVLIRRVVRTIDVRLLLFVFVNCAVHHSHSMSSSTITVPCLLVLVWSASIRLALFCLSRLFRGELQRNNSSEQHRYLIVEKKFFIIITSNARRYDSLDPRLNILETFFSIRFVLVSQ